jgi:hypothetical protein
MDRITKGDSTKLSKLTEYGSNILNAFALSGPAGVAHPLYARPDGKCSTPSVLQVLYALCFFPTFMNYSLVQQTNTAYIDFAR